MDFQRRGSKRSPWLAILATCLAIVVGAAATRWGISRFLPSEPTVDSRTVVLDIVRRGEFLHEVRCVGQLTSLEQNEIPARTSARVKRIVQLPGVDVTADTLIVELANPDLDVAMLEAQSKLSEAKSALTTETARFESQLIELQSKLTKLESDHAEAQEKYVVSEDLFRKDAFSGKQLKFLAIKKDGLKKQRDLALQAYERYRSSRTDHLAVFEERISQAQNNVRHAEALQDSLKVFAGMDGVLARVPVTEGQQLEAGEQVAKVVNPKRLKAELRVAEVEARYIQTGQTAKVDTRHGISRGVVTRVEPEVKEGSVTIDVVFDAAKLPQEARPDLSVTGLVEVNRLTDVLFVGLPAAAMAEGSGKLYSIGTSPTSTVGSSQARATLKSVEYGIASANEIVVRRGLSEGEQVIISDLSKFDDAANIRLNDYSPPLDIRSSM